MKVSLAGMERREGAEGARDQKKPEWVLEPAQHNSAYTLGWRSGPNGASYKDITESCGAKCCCNTDSYCHCVEEKCPERD